MKVKNQSFHRIFLWTFVDLSIRPADDFPVRRPYHSISLYRKGTVRYGKIMKSHREKKAYFYFSLLWFLYNFLLFYTLLVQIPKIIAHLCWRTIYNFTSDRVIVRVKHIDLSDTSVKLNVQHWFQRIWIIKDSMVKTVRYSNR